MKRGSFLRGFFDVESDGNFVGISDDIGWSVFCDDFVGRVDVIVDGWVENFEDEKAVEGFVATENCVVEI